MFHAISLAYTGARLDYSLFDPVYPIHSKAAGNPRVLLPRAEEAHGRLLAVLSISECSINDIQWRFDAVDSLGSTGLVYNREVSTLQSFEIL